MNDRGTMTSDVSSLESLTKREREVLGLIGQGLSVTEIAQRLHRAEKTVETHRSSLGRKLGVANRVELARIAIQAGLAPLPGRMTDDGRTTNRRLREEVSRGELAQRALFEIESGTAASTGDEFFRSLTRHLASALDMKYALVAEIVDDPPLTAKTIAVWFGDGSVGRIAA